MLSTLSFESLDITNLDFNMLTSILLMSIFKLRFKLFIILLQLQIHLFNLSSHSSLLQKLILAQILKGLIREYLSSPFIICLS